MDDSDILLDRQDVFTAARNAKTSLVVSLAYGLIQDAISLVKGNKLGYVEFVKGKIKRQSGLPSVA